MASFLDNQKVIEAFTAFCAALNDNDYYLYHFEVKKFADIPPEGTYFGVSFKVL
jgi:hypothetical protein